MTTIHLIADSQPVTQQLIDQHIQRIHRLRTIRRIAGLRGMQHPPLSVEHIVDEIDQFQMLRLDIAVTQIHDGGAMAFIERTVLREITAEIIQSIGGLPQTVGIDRPQLVDQPLLGGFIRRMEFFRSSP